MEYFVPMLGLALLGLVAGWPAPENDKLHKHMTSEESVEAFNSEGPDFPEYDVVPIHLPKSSEKADRVRVKAFGRSIDLELSPNNEVLIDKDTPIYLLREDTTRPAGFTYSRTSNVMGGVQQTLENLKSEASLLVKRSANGEQTISGHIGSESWIIRPVPERLRPPFNFGHENTSATDSTPVYHFVYKTHPSPVGPDYFTVRLAWRFGSCLTDYDQIMGQPYNMAAGVIQDTGSFEGIITAAHELGHLFGAGHDGEDNQICPSTTSHIMAPSQRPLAKNGSEWSQCSISNMTQFLRTPKIAKCLYNKPTTPSALPRFIPGEFFSPEEHCSKAKSGHYYPDSHNSCLYITCIKKLDDGTDMMDNITTLDGTSCGSNKICYKGKCVDEQDVV